MFTRTSRLPVPRKKETVTVTRTMGLVPDTRRDFVPPPLFEGIKGVSNAIIKAGSILPAGWFLGGRLEDAKRFYDRARAIKGFNAMLEGFVYKERVRRCAATSSYYCLQGYQHRVAIVPALASTLRANSIDTMLDDQFLTNSFLDETRAKLRDSMLPRGVQQALLGKIRNGKPAFPKDEEKRSTLIDEIRASGLPVAVIEALLDDTGEKHPLDPDLVDKVFIPRGLLDREYLSNLARGLRNIVRKALFTEHGELVVSAARECLAGKSRQRVIDAVATDLAAELEGLATSWFREIAKRMKRRIKDVNALLAGTRDRVKPVGTHHLDELIGTILGDHPGGKLPGWVDGKPVDLAAWQTARLAWRDEQRAALESLVSAIDPVAAVAAATGDVDAMLDPGTAVGAMFKSRAIPGCRGLVPSPGNLETIVRSKAISLIFNHVGTAAWRAVAPVARGILDEIIADPRRHVNQPRVTRTHLPFGIDDEKVFRCSIETDASSGVVTGMRASISLLPRKFLHFHVKTSSLPRITELLWRGFEIKKGTLTRKTPGGGMLLHAPFQQDCGTKDVPATTGDGANGPPGDDGKSPFFIRVAGVDLGVKHLAWLSIADCLRERDGNGFLQRLHEKAPDIARHVIDQEQLLGSRSGWFPASWLVNGHDGAGSEVDEPVPNWKGTLAKAFTRAHHLQRQLASIVEHHGSKKRAKKTVAWKQIRKEWKRTWKRIRHVHEELAKQVATRIVAACEHFGVELLRFEDLSWSRHSSKRVAGCWLASWQVHWFHSRIQQHATLLARVAGIAVEKVNAAGTSKRCSYCGEKGTRDGKRFACKACSRTIDSDLNAARNVVIAPCSRHGKAFLPAFDISRGRRIQATMMSPISHSPGLKTPKGCAPVTRASSCT